MLVIDDNEQICSLLHDLLARRHIITESTLTGQEGLDRARQKRFDLILLDMTLPDIDGVEVCRMLKADPAVKTVPVVMMSGNDTDEDKELSLSAGAVDFIAKPFKLAEVALQVFWAIQRKP